MRRYDRFAPLLDLAGMAYAEGMLLYDALDRRNEAVKGDIERELGRVLGARTVFELWSYGRRFETDFARYCGKRFGIGTSSCTAALQLALSCSGVGPGDEVITSAHTFIATALAIHNTGARPLLVDPEPGSLCIAAEGIERALTPRVKAIVPVHMHGHAAPMVPILELARDRGLAVIEDCAQAARRGVPVGATGCISFFPTKPLGGAGNGGIVVTDDEALAARIEKARDPEGGDPIVLAGARTPCYLNAMEIALVRAKLPQLEAWTQAREKIASRYAQEFSDHEPVLPSEGSAWNSFVVRLKNRDRVKRAMLLAGVETRVEYSPPFFESDTFAEMGWRPDDFPVATDAARRGLSLPIHPFLTEREQDRVIEALRKSLRR